LHKELKRNFIFLSNLKGFLNKFLSILIKNINNPYLISLNFLVILYLEDMLLNFSYRGVKCILYSFQLFQQYGGSLKLVHNPIKDDLMVKVLPQIHPALHNEPFHHL